MLSLVARICVCCSGVIDGDEKIAVIVSMAESLSQFLHRMQADAYDEESPFFSEYVGLRELASELDCKCHTCDGKAALVAKEINSMFEKMQHEKNVNTTASSGLGKKVSYPDFSKDKKRSP